MMCSFHCASRTHYSSRRNSREVRLSGRCVRWLSLPSTSTQIDTAAQRKFHLCRPRDCPRCARTSAAATTRRLSSATPPGDTGTLPAQVELSLGDRKSVVEGKSGEAHGRTLL